MCEVMCGRRRGEVLLTEAEEERVHAHGVHAEEAVGDEIGADRHSLVTTTHISIRKSQYKTITEESCCFLVRQTHQDGNPVVVQIGGCILKGLHSPREEEEGKDRCGNMEITHSHHELRP